jgi:Ca-activated chloride channel family protein
MIDFARPWLLGLLAVPALVALARELGRRSGRGVVDLPGLPRFRPTLRARLAFLPAALSLIGLAATIVALAGPRRLRPRPVGSGSGVAIAVALDVSGSMAAEDFRPRNRLEVARSVTADFIRGRPNDSLALLAFAGRAVTVCPATDDQATLLSLLAQASGERLPDGTAIGNALATAVARLKDLPGKSKVVVLVTDGGNNAGQIDPQTAADLARAYGIRVHTIGVGRGGRVPITLTMRDPETGRSVKRRIEADVAIDEDLLRKIAAATGGKFFRATDSDALRSIFREIDGLEKSPRPVRMEIVAEDLSFFPAVAAAALLAISTILFSGPLRVETEAA